MQPIRSSASRRRRRTGAIAAGPAVSGAVLPALLGESCIPGRRQITRLANGLTVCLVENRQAPVVTTALTFRAGTRDEAAGHGGVAHFLEHMMFKGAKIYGAGEIDRRTQALGGSNNAFTSHDATTYYFSFAADRWTEALAIEADRMAALALAPAQVASERQVILEEIAMYDSEPWDALDVAVQKRLFRGHPYGKAVLGARGELRASGRKHLADFQRSFYRPDNAVLVVAGDLDTEAALAEVDRHLGGLPGAPGASGPLHRTAASPPVNPAGMARLLRRKGEVPRMMLSLPVPAGDAADFPAVRLLATLLGSGRTSRLYHSLVDDLQLCSWVQAEAVEALDAGHLTIAAELVPGVAPKRVENQMLRLLAELVAAPPPVAEVERARQVALADWVIHHEKVEQQALSLAISLALFDAGHLDRQLRRLLACGPAELHEAAGRYLRPELGSVLGWSLPRTA